eukprot:scaffold383636_cov175-Cyclotella_meneghiniana.AAC.1
MEDNLGAILLQHCFCLILDLSFRIRSRACNCCRGFGLLASSSPPPWSREWRQGKRAKKTHGLI